LSPKEQRIVLEITVVMAELFEISPSGYYRSISKGPMGMLLTMKPELAQVFFDENRRLYSTNLKPKIAYWPQSKEIFNI
jgi:hypothetical protein